MILASLFMGTVVLSQGNSGPENYLNSPASITFNGSVYNLVWSSHPSTAYYKQEYLPKGETAERYSSMFMLEVLTSKVNVKDVMANKIAELQSMKATNPHVSFQVIQPAVSGEQILDFTLTANAADGKQIAIAERNIYRYVPYKNKNGENGLLLIAISQRGYGSAAANFLEQQKRDKMSLTAKIKDLKIPAISIK